MSYGVDQLKGQISAKGGIARGNIFRVKLPSLPGASATEVNLLCTKVNLPGKQVLTYDREIGMKREKIAYGFVHDDITMSFLLLNDYGIKKYFETWQSLAVNTDTYELGYKNEYSFTIQVEQLRKGVGLPVYSTALGIPKLPSEIQNRLPKIGPFDFAQGQFDLNFLTGDQVVYTCTLFEAFPTTMMAVELANDQEGLMELTVAMSYTKWTSETKQATPGLDFAKSQIGTLLTKLF
tara:strand:+ start:899 stop:1606 length:708 start_codon:yes stop_codon:yes gene_type:complete